MNNFLLQKKFILFQNLYTLRSQSRRKEKPFLLRVNLEMRLHFIQLRN